MQAAIRSTFGAPDVLRIAEIDSPALGSDQVRVAVHASAVTKGDPRVRASDLPEDDRSARLIDILEVAMHASSISVYLTAFVFAIYCIAHCVG